MIKEFGGLTSTYYTATLNEPLPELVRWMVEDYGYDQWDAYMMLSQCGKVRLGNFVDPKYTMGAAISKSYL